nr:unnamed protein product [Callosobruchus chinensis]
MHRCPLVIGPHGDHMTMASPNEIEECCSVFCTVGVENWDSRNSSEAILFEVVSMSSSSPVDPVPIECSLAVGGSETVVDTFEVFSGSVKASSLDIEGELSLKFVPVSLAVNSVEWILEISEACQVSAELLSVTPSLDIGGELSLKCIPVSSAVNVIVFMLVTSEASVVCKELLPVASSLGTEGELSLKLVLVCLAVTSVEWILEISEACQVSAELLSVAPSLDIGASSLGIEGELTLKLVLVCLAVTSVEWILEISEAGQVSAELLSVAPSLDIGAVRGIVLIEVTSEASVLCKELLPVASSLDIEGELSLKFVPISLAVTSVEWLVEISEACQVSAKSLSVTPSLDIGVIAIVFMLVTLEASVVYKELFPVVSSLDIEGEVSLKFVPLSLAVTSVEWILEISEACQVSAELLSVTPSLDIGGISCPVPVLEPSFTKLTVTFCLELSSRFSMDVTHVATSLSSQDIILMSSIPVVWSQVASIELGLEVSATLSFRESISCGVGKVVVPICPMDAVPPVTCSFTGVLSPFTLVFRRSPAVRLAGAVTNFSSFPVETELLTVKSRVAVSWIERGKVLIVMIEAVSVLNDIRVPFSDTEIPVSTMGSELVSITSAVTFEDMLLGFVTSALRGAAPTSGTPPPANVPPASPMLMPKLFRSTISEAVLSDVAFSDSVVDWIDSDEPSSVIDVEVAVRFSSMALASMFSSWSSMSFTRKVNALVYQYNINKEELQIVAENKDLGVIFDKSLSFNPHINELLALISKKLGFIIRNSRDFTDSKVTRILYNACVLSKLEYGRLVWNPCYVTTCESIEKLQKRFLKYLSFREDGIYPAVGTPYAELLLRHNFVSLDNRRKVHSLRFGVAAQSTLNHQSHTLANWLKTVPFGHRKLNFCPFGRHQCHT